jgi:hypothetical protein
MIFHFKSLMNPYINLRFSQPNPWLDVYKMLSFLQNNFQSYAKDVQVFIWLINVIHNGGLAWIKGFPLNTLYYLVCQINASRFESNFLYASYILCMCAKFSP